MKVFLFYKNINNLNIYSVYIVIPFVLFLFAKEKIEGIFLYILKLTNIILELFGKCC